MSEITHPRALTWLDLNSEFCSISLREIRAVRTNPAVVKDCDVEVTATYGSSDDHFHYIFKAQVKPRDDEGEPVGMLLARVVVSFKFAGELPEIPRDEIIDFGDRVASTHGVPYATQALRIASAQVGFDSQLLLRKLRRLGRDDTPQNPRGYHHHESDAAPANDPA